MYVSVQSNQTSAILNNIKKSNKDKLKSKQKSTAIAANRKNRSAADTNEKLFLRLIQSFNACFFYKRNHLLQESRVTYIRERVEYRTAKTMATKKNDFSKLVTFLVFNIRSFRAFLFM